MLKKSSQKCPGCLAFWQQRAQPRVRWSSCGRPVRGHCCSLHRRTRSIGTEGCRGRHDVCSGQRGSLLCCRGEDHQLPEGHSESGFLKHTYLMLSSFAECAEKDTIPTFRVIEKLKKVKTVSDCTNKCIHNPDCDFYKWKVTQTQSQFILSLI